VRITENALDKRRSDRQIDSKQIIFPFQSRSRYFVSLFDAPSGRGEEKSSKRSWTIANARIEIKGAPLREYRTPPSPPSLSRMPSACPFIAGSEKTQTRLGNLRAIGSLKTNVNRAEAGTETEKQKRAEKREREKEKERDSARNNGPILFPEDSFTHAR